MAVVVVFVVAVLSWVFFRADLDFERGDATKEEDEEDEGEEALRGARMREEGGVLGATVVGSAPRRMCVAGNEGGSSARRVWWREVRAVAVRASGAWDGGVVEGIGEEVSRTMVLGWAGCVGRVESRSGRKVCRSVSG